MYFQFVFCRSIYLRSISHATLFSPLFAPANSRPFSFLLAPSRVGQSQLLAFVRSRATLKIPYLLRKIFFLPTSKSSPLLPHQTRLSFVFGSYPVRLPIHPDNIPEIPSSGSAKYAC